jgi:predicted nucleic acid-binding protein
MAYLADTNIVIRRVVAGDPQYSTISAALTLLDRQSEAVSITAQNLVEFQALATRPVTANGWGMTTVQASTEARKIEAIFPLLPETPAIYPLWRNLINTYNVIGRQVYDARLVAVMLAYGITHILTLDPTGFRRFPMITVMTPQDVINLPP